MGEISLLDNLIEDVPSKVREGGWEGYESKRIERHVATHLHDYFKKIAKRTFELFKKNHFDWLFLGCRDKYRSDFEPLLHPYLKSSLKGWLKAMPSDSPSTVLKESLGLEKKLKKGEEDEIVHALVSELEKGGLATSGLKRTLRGLNRGEVQTLITTSNFSKPGRICPKCHFLFVDELRCPSCKRKTDPRVDVIDEAVEAAMDKNCQVRHIIPPSKLDRYGKIGAFLRYKT
jgi:peptide subunit release factor 1 (eRF1)